MCTESEQLSKWIAGGRSPICHCWSEFIDKQGEVPRMIHGVMDYS